MEFKLNCSPLLKMSDITKRLFNRNFHSDVHFSVGGQIVYAHSLELINRSVVFEQLLEDSMGSKTLIPMDCKYESFLEFMRFIYTDECEITEDNGIEILRLATKYKIIKLENKVIHSFDSIAWFLKLFEYCVVEEYEFIRNVMNEMAACSFDRYLADSQFLSLHPEAVYELLTFERIKMGVREADIFIGLLNWITSYCKTHQKKFMVERVKFDYLINKIHFRAIPIKEICLCTKKASGLLNLHYCRKVMAEQSERGRNDHEYGLRISKCRETYIEPYELRSFKCDTVFKTRLTVSTETVLCGMRFGVWPRAPNPIEIEISSTNNDKLIFRLTGTAWRDLTINLGESLCLRSNYEYTITFNYIGPPFEVWCRTDGFDAIINDVAKSVHILEISSNVLEMFFKSLTD